MSVASRGARADATGPSSGRAEALFREGRALRAAGRSSAACTAFEESRRLEDGIGVTLYLADCYESLGDTVRARSEYTRAELLAVERGDPRWEVALRRAAALVRAAPVRPAEVRVAAASSATAVETTSPQAVRPEVSGTPPGEPARVPEVAPVTAPHADGRVLPSSPGPLSAPRARPGDARRWVGLGIAGAGVAGLALGTAFGAIAAGDLSQSNHGPCDAAGRCTSDGLALRQHAVEAARISTLGLAAGGAALVTGIALCVTVPRTDVTAAFIPAPATGGALASFAGRF
ncbi:MAG: hypothetical protein ACRENE_04915 [Polyangiaceae bacterium]